MGKAFSIVLIVIFFSINALQAQWAIAYGSKHNDHLTSIISTEDSGYLLTGFTTITLAEAIFSSPACKEDWLIWGE